MKIYLGTWPYEDSQRESMNKVKAGYILLSFFHIRDFLKKSKKNENILGKYSSRA